MVKGWVPFILSMGDEDKLYEHGGSHPTATGETRRFRQIEFVNLQ